MESQPQNPEFRTNPENFPPCNKNSTRAAIYGSYYSSIQSLYRHVVCNVWVSCKANGDRNQFGAWVDIRQ